MPLNQPPAGLVEEGLVGGFGEFIRNGEEGAVGLLDGAGVAQIAGGAVLGDDEGVAPGAGAVFAEAGLIAEGWAAMAVGHEEAAIAQAEQLGRMAPDADRVRLGPRLAAVDGFGLQGLVVVRLVLLANV